MSINSFSFIAFLRISGQPYSACSLASHLFMEGQKQLCIICTERAIEKKFQTLLSLYLYINVYRIFNHAFCSIGNVCVPESSIAKFVNYNVMYI